jgi:predicted cupin superfamily sugar epimerase
LSVSFAMSPQEIIATLGMKPHPEGGHFVETWRHQPTGGGRGAGTAIYYLLEAGERSHWHRVDAAEIWHWYAGAPLELALSSDGQQVAVSILGDDLTAGARPQVLVPEGVWQSAASTGAWTLVGCTVSPAFEFSGFEMAPPGWAPQGRRA